MNIKNIINITKPKFIDINKYIALSGTVLFFLCILTPIKYLQGGLIFVLGAAFFCLFHKDYFATRLKEAAGIWFFAVFMTIITTTIPMVAKGAPDKVNIPLYIITLLSCVVPTVMFLIGKSSAKPQKKETQAIVSARIFFQMFSFLFFLWVTALIYVKGVRYFEGYWAFIHVSTAGIFCFLFGRILCSWLCPMSVWQDALLKNMDYKRPITLSKDIDEQSRSCSMNMAGDVDKNAPLLPATLLIVWFVGFNIESFWELSTVKWWPAIAFFVVSASVAMLMPWRKFCTHFCWLSGYRTLGSQGSLWRLHFNKENCKECKKCAAEEACPFYIDIRNQEYEMPASCCVCFSCRDACPFEGVITRRMPFDIKRKWLDSFKGKKAG